MTVEEKLTIATNALKAISKRVYYSNDSINSMSLDCAKCAENALKMMEEKKDDCRRET